MGKTRKLGCWLDAFLEYTEPLPSPLIFKKWAGIVTLAGALERKVWTISIFGTTYPNLFVFFVAPPGVGKGLLTNRIIDLWEKLEDQYLASTSVSRASMVDDLRDAERRLIRPSETPSIISFNSIKIASNELAVLIPAYENDFMNVLTDIYDGHSFSERKRTRDLKYKLDAPQITLIAATTPSYLSSLLPEGAWDQGFLSRTLLIYSGETILKELFGEEIKKAATWKSLVHDLKIIADLYGKMSFTPEAAAAIGAWHRAGGPPRPDHPKLVNYCTRRTAHLLKLCMVASVSDSDDLVITVAHYQRALDWLLELEVSIPDIFKSMAVGGDSAVIKDCWHFAYKTYLKDKKPIPEYRIITFLQERLPAHSVMRLLEVMVRAQILKESLEPKVGKAYVPKSLRDIG